MNVRSLGGITFLLGLATLVGASIWLEQSQLGTRSVTDHGLVSYYLCSASRGQLVADIAGVAVALFVLHATLQSRLLRRRWNGFPPYADVRYFRPLALLGSNLAVFGVWLPAVRDWWAPIAYFAIDLHPVVIVAASALFVAEIDAMAHHAIRVSWHGAVARLRGQTGRLFRDAGVAAAAVAIVLASSPKLRFSSIVVGDEPKYLRYCETWRQGLGMSVEHFRDVSALPRNETSHFMKTFASFGPAVRHDLVDLAADVRRLRNPQYWHHRFKRSVYAGNSIVSGKRGGLYQMHSPGISAIILPAYALDRLLFDRRTSRFADDLFCVNLVFLTMFALVAVTTWRLTAASAPSAVAAIAALTVVLSLPVGAFAFQFYPEMMAALVVCLIGRHFVAPVALDYRVALFIGFGLGLLAWLHVRYLPMVAVGFTWMTWTHRRDRQTLAAAVSMFGLLMAVLCLYQYHVTGSIFPTAIYEPEGGRQQFAWSAVPRGMLTEFFDRDYGLLPLTPALLLALPGLGLMLRRQHRALLLVVSFGLALCLPIAGHGVEVAGTTPGRFVLAVVPLAALPIAEWLRVIWRRPSLVAVSALLLGLSVWNCVAHDLQNEKIFLTMTASGFSGWNPSMLFPRTHFGAWLPTPFDRAVLILWASLGVVLVAWGAISANRQSEEGVPIEPAHATSLAAVCLTTVAALGVAAALAGGPSREAQFLPTRNPPPPRAAQAFASNRQCWIHLSTPPVRVDPAP